MDIIKVRNIVILIFTKKVDRFLKTSCSQKGYVETPPSTAAAIYSKMLSLKIHKSIYWFEFKHLFL